MLGLLERECTSEHNVKHARSLRAGWDQRCRATEPSANDDLRPTPGNLAAKCPKPLVTGALAVLTGSVPVGTRAVLPTLPWTSTSGSAAGYKQLAASKAGLHQG